MIPDKSEYLFIVDKKKYLISPNLISIAPKHIITKKIIDELCNCVFDNTFQIEHESELLTDVVCNEVLRLLLNEHTSFAITPDSVADGSSVGIRRLFGKDANTKKQIFEIILNQKIKGTFTFLYYTID
jgi:hypothetical protein